MSLRGSGIYAESPCWRSKEAMGFKRRFHDARGFPTYIIYEFLCSGFQERFVPASRFSLRRKWPQVQEHHLNKTVSEDDGIGELAWLIATN